MDAALVAMLDVNDGDDVVTNDTTRPSDRCGWFGSSYFVVAVLAIAAPKRRSLMAAVLMQNLVNSERPRIDGAKTPKVALSTWTTIGSSH